MTDPVWSIPDPGPQSTDYATYAMQARPREPDYASPMMRFASYLVDQVLYYVTLIIGWLIWALLTGPHGQTPAKKLLHLRVIRESTGQPAGLAWMFWVRGIFASVLGYVLIGLTIGVLAFMPFWDKRNRTIFDVLSGCYVVMDPPGYHA